MRPSSRPPARDAMRAGRTLLVTLALASALAAPPAHAQSFALDRVDAKTVHLEIAKPFLEGDGDRFFTTTWWASTRLRLNDRLSFVGELPFATATYRFGGPFGTDESSTTLGNPYLGIETRAADGGGTWLEFGVRVPAASDDEFATATGLATDVDRWEAFLPDVVVVRTGLHWRDDPVGKVGADVRLVPAFWISNDLADDVEVFATYGAQILYHGATVRAGGGFGGRWLATEDGGDFGEESTHQFEAAADFGSGSTRPGVTLRVPFDDDTGTDLAIGLTLNVVLR